MQEASRAYEGARSHRNAAPCGDSPTAGVPAKHQCSVVYTAIAQRAQIAVWDYLVALHCFLTQHP
eukprot:6182982-Pleurochrysis_carterae.AAC.5